MAPNVIGSTFILAESVIEDSKSTTSSTKSNITKDINLPSESLSTPINGTTITESITTIGSKEKVYKVEIVWRNVIAFIALHAAAFYGIYLAIVERAFVEVVLAYFLLYFSGMGITAGAHRLWSHRAYKAKTPLRVFLMICNTMAFQNSIHEWTRDHRVHHKFTDTDADPHNSRRGFFFAHMGWLMCKKHPDVKEKGKQIDMSDLEADPVVMFQKKYYLWLMPVCCFLVPTLMSYALLGSSLRLSFFVCGAFRYCLSLHGTWLVNSAAHFYGMKPYDKSISSVNTKTVAMITYGEGWHNYHHVFPWDYKAAELGNYHNWTTGFLNFAARFGQAYDMKTVSKDMILKRIQRTGDGSHPWSIKDLNNNEATLPGNGPISYDLMSLLDHEKEKILVWGWDDVDVSEEDRKNVTILERKDN